MGGFGVEIGRKLGWSWGEIEQGFGRNLGEIKGVGVVKQVRALAALAIVSRVLYTPLHLCRIAEQKRPSEKCEGRCFFRIFGLGVQTSVNPVPVRPWLAA